MPVDSSDGPESVLASFMIGSGVMGKSMSIIIGFPGTSGLNRGKRRLSSDSF